MGALDGGTLSPKKSSVATPAMKLALILRKKYVVPPPVGV